MAVVTWRLRMSSARLEPAVGRIDVFLILGGIGHVHPRGQDAVGAGRIVRRPVDFFSGKSLARCFPCRRRGWTACRRPSCCTWSAGLREWTYIYPSYYLLYDFIFIFYCLRPSRGPQHLVGRGDHLGRGRVGVLELDKVAHFLVHVHAGHGLGAGQTGRWSGPCGIRYWSLERRLSEPTVVTRLA